MRFDPFRYWGQVSYRVGVYVRIKKAEPFLTRPLIIFDSLKSNPPPFVYYFQITYKPHNR